MSTSDAQPVGVTQADVQKAYIAFFNRPADPLGQAYWAAQDDLPAMLEAFANTAEFRNQYEGLSAEQAVAMVYTNLFGREPEAEGLAYWSGQLASGHLSLGEIAFTVLGGASGSDLAVVENKVAAAQAFTDSIDTVSEIRAYGSEDAVTVARAWLAAVDETPESLENAVNAAEGLTDAMEAAFAPGPAARATPAEALAETTDPADAGALLALIGMVHSFGDPADGF